MHAIEMQEMSEQFFGCWDAARKHLGKQVDGGIRSWLRAHPYSPFLEHLSFRLGNQLFFVRVEDVDGAVIGPGSGEDLASAAREAGGHACVIPMRRQRDDQSWSPVLPGWGLISADSRRALDPFALVTDENIEMTHWEVHDMAVQVVRDRLTRAGLSLMAWQSHPNVDPSIWVVDSAGQPQWVVVRAVRFPLVRAARPDNWAAIAETCRHVSDVGYFASVSISHADQTPDQGDRALPLLRGHGLRVRFDGLE